jgi:hypothetical protein
MPGNISSKTTGTTTAANITSSTTTSDYKILNNAR